MSNEKQEIEHVTNADENKVSEQVLASQYTTQINSAEQQVQKLDRRLQEMLGIQAETMEQNYSVLKQILELRIPLNELYQQLELTLSQIEEQQAKSEEAAAQELRIHKIIDIREQITKSLKAVLREVYVRYPEIVLKTLITQANKIIEKSKTSLSEFSQSRKELKEISDEVRNAFKNIIKPHLIVAAQTFVEENYLHKIKALDRVEKIEENIIQILTEIKETHQALAKASESNETPEIEHKAVAAQAPMAITQEKSAQQPPFSAQAQEGRLVLEPEAEQALIAEEPLKQSTKSNPSVSNRESVLASTFWLSGQSGLNSSASRGTNHPNESEQAQAPIAIAERTQEQSVQQPNSSDINEESIFRVIMQLISNIFTFFGMNHSNEARQTQVAEEKMLEEQTVGRSWHI